MLHNRLTLPCTLKLLMLVVAFLATSTRSNLYAETAIPFTLPQRSEILKIRSAILETSEGDLFFELLPEEAPWHVANFKYLADKHFYDGLRFHFFKAGYIIQGGDPKNNGYGGPGYSLPPEFTQRNHKRGVLGMARRPDGYDNKNKLINPQRESSGSQFHILLGDAPHMNGRYTIFGKLVGGSTTLDKLSSKSTITRLTVFIREGGR